MLEIGIDIGGTFVDGVAFDRQHLKLWHWKVPAHIGPIEGTLACVDELLAMAGGNPEAVTRVAHGTTLATNALIQRTGARTALLTTEGFRDVLEIQRGCRGDQVYDVIGYQRPIPLVPRRLRVGIPERVDATGDEVKPLDEKSVLQAIRLLRKHNVESVAIGFLHSYKNPSHELRAASLVREHCPGVPISVSSQVCPEPREYERFSTCVINAYVQPRLVGYLRELAANLAERGISVPLHIMQSSGSLLPSHLVEHNAVQVVQSGVAAGALAGSLIARMTGIPDILAIDMGGTSFDVSLVQDFRVRLVRAGEAEGYAIRMPMVDITSIGAGGGSIAWVDKGGLLQVGPSSAGADPGPACYGQGGTEPTVTDAHVVLGRLAPEGLLGGRMPIHPELAEAAVDQVAELLGLDRIETASGILSVVNAAMARAMRRVTIERGHDPRGLTLVAYGGAGPLHAVDLARALGIPKVAIPAIPGCFSALGLLCGFVETEAVRSYEKPLRKCMWDEVNSIFERLDQQILDSLGEPKDAVRLERYADLQYSGQGHQISVPLPGMDVYEDGSLSHLEADFVRRYEKLFNYIDPEGEVEVVAFRVRGTVAADEGLPEGWVMEWPELPVSARKRDVFFAASGGWTSTEIFARSQLAPGDRLTGPALIEQLDSTILLPPNSQAIVDRYGNLIIDCGGV